MKQSTSIRQTNSLSDADLRQLQNDGIVAAYIGSLPPRSSNLHGGSVDLFFDQGSFSIQGEIVQVGYKQEAFYIGFGDTLGIGHWHNEMAQQSGRPVIENIDLLSSWSGKGLTALFSGPREVRSYGSRDLVDEPSESDFFLKGIELISLIDPKQRVAFIASEDDPGDIIVLTPGNEYEAELDRLRLV